MYPPDTRLHQSIIDRISKVLYIRLGKMIPEGNDTIQDVTLPYAQNTDGYGLLYSIMRQSLPWLTTNKGGWCQHEWKDGMSASKYASLIQQVASESEVTTGITRSEVEMSLGIFLSSH